MTIYKPVLIGVGEARTRRPEEYITDEARSADHWNSRMEDTIGGRMDHQFQLKKFPPRLRGGFLAAGT